VATAFELVAEVITVLALPRAVRHHATAEHCVPGCTRQHAAGHRPARMLPAGGIRADTTGMESKIRL
jgi:hypothetical protein